MVGSLIAGTSNNLSAILTCIKAKHYSIDFMVFFPPYQWLNLCLDLSSLVSGLFKASPFKSLEWLCLGGSCSLRRVFTLKTTPLPGADCDLPKSCLLPQGTEQPLTLVSHCCNDTHTLPPSLYHEATLIIFIKSLCE